MFHVSILILRNAVLGSITDSADLFDKVNEFIKEKGQDPPFQVQLVGFAEEVKYNSGKYIIRPDTLFDAVKKTDLIIIPSFTGHLSSTTYLNKDCAMWIADHYKSGAEVASLSTGAFLLAEAGLLDGRRVTTHWAYCASLAARYPRVSVEEDPIFVRDGNIATSAGVTAGIDLALALVEEDLGRDVALDIARQLVVFLRRPGNQAQFSAQLAGQLANREPLREVQRWIADHPGADLSVEALARQASLSPRQFARAFAAEVGMPPGRYVDRVRLETARRRLEDTADGVEQTARSCGYGTPEAMRRAFVRALGVSPGEYRRRFRPAAISN
jgi:transcriptional regulator GlxA family with amidase domain